MAASRTMTSCFTPRLATALAGTLLGLVATAAQAADPAPGTAPAVTATTTGTNPGVGGTVTTSSGLVFKLMKAGAGPSPTATDTVKVHYRGTLADGKEFDSSYSRGKPLEFPLNRVIKCWTEGVQRLQVGGSARLTCPPAIAYGERGAGGVIPPNATLTFDVELLGIVGR
jgi:FKBP-type peptidyl-prolyl cis-trans isomerase FkpA